MILALLILIVFARDVLLKSAISLYYSPQNIQINCLDTQLEWPVALSVSDLCIVSPGIKINLKNGKWLHSKQQLNVEKVDVEHIVAEAQAIPEQENANQDTLLKLNSLPLNLPDVLIQNLTIDSHLLASPLRLKLDLKQSRHLQIGGDIQASLEIKDGKLGAKFDWRLDDLEFIPAVKSLLEEYKVAVTQDLKDNVVITELSFDGIGIESKHTVALNYPLSLEACNIDFRLEGEIGLNVPNIASTQELFADFSELLVQANIDRCEYLPEQLESWDITQVSINVPEVVSLADQKVLMPLLKLQQSQTQKQNLLSLTLQALELDLAKKRIETQYHLHVQQTLPSPLFSQGHMELLSSGSVNARQSESGLLADTLWQLNAKNEIGISEAQSGQAKIAVTTSDFRIIASSHNGVQIDGSVDIPSVLYSGTRLENLNANFKASLTPQMQVQSLVELRSKALHSEQVKISNSSGKIVFTSTINQSPNIALLARFKDIEASGNIEAKELSISNLKTSSIKNEFSISGADFDKVLVTAQTNITPSVLQTDGSQLKLEKLNIEHYLTSNMSLAGTESKHSLTLGKQFNAQISQSAANISLNINDQNVTSLAKLSQQLLPSLSLSQGTLNAAVSTQITTTENESKFIGELNLADLSGNYSSSLFKGAYATVPFSFAAGEVIIEEGAVTVNSVNAGVPLENIKAKLQSESHSFKLSQLEGNLLGGSFGLAELWLDNREQAFDLVLQDMDLQKVAALQDQPGIQVSGKMMGRLPLVKSTSGFAIDQGRMLSQDSGKLTIRNNPAFDTIKEQQPELAYLEDYQFSQLASKVSLQTDGMLVLDLAFTGKNEAKKQAVNFNYNHQENIFDLLKAKRIADGIQDKIERSITRGAQQ
jgi:hypothetical protein